MITPEQAKARWVGVLAPIVTPFKEDLSLDLDSLRRNVQWLLDRGARQGNTIFLTAGSGGDFTSMNLEERKQVIRATAEVVGDRAPIIAGAQSNDIRDCIAIANLCEDLGIDAIQISGPFYYDGRPGDVIAWMETLSRNTKAGFAVYNNWYTGYDMSIELIERLLDIPNSIGVKWGSPSGEVFMEGARRLRARTAVVNNSFLTIPGFIEGVKGWVSHWPNWYPEMCWKIHDLMEAGKFVEAQAQMDSLMAPYNALVGKVAVQTGGEGVFCRPLMKLVGLNGGRSRLPSRDEAVTPEIVEGFRRVLANVGALPVKA